MERALAGLDVPSMRSDERGGRGVVAFGLKFSFPEGPKRKMRDVPVPTDPNLIV